MPRSAAACSALPAIQYFGAFSATSAAPSPPTASTMWSRSNTPTIASMPGAHSSSLARWRCTRQPATTTRLISPFSLRRIASWITSSDSSFDASRKPQVFTTIASGRWSSFTSSKPDCLRTPSIFSLSTRFFGQPRLTKLTRAMSGFFAVMDRTV